MKTTRTTMIVTCDHCRKEIPSAAAGSMHVEEAKFNSSAETTVTVLDEDFCGFTCLSQRVEKMSKS